MKIYLSNTKDLMNKNLFNAFYSLMSSERKAKIDRYIFGKDKRLSLGAGILLRLGLCESGINADEAEFQIGENGKPYLSENYNVFFNLSHSDEMVMCVIADNEVGCDIEKINDIDLDIAKNYFYSSEYKLILSRPTKEKRNDTFFRLWTLKESFMKLTGLGMSLPLDAFKIDLNDKKITVEQNVDDKIYFFKEYYIDGNYKCACCCLSDNFSEKPEFIRLCQIYDRLCSPNV